VKWNERLKMTHKDLGKRLQDAIFEVFKLEVIIILNKNKIHINGIQDKIDELKVYLFVSGFLYAMRTQNRRSIPKVFNPESQVI
jgi:hypothetical protein